MIFDNRAQSSAKAVIGENYQGMAITDRYGAYSFLPPSQRQYCWAHLKRNFVRMSEKLNPHKAFIGQCLLSTMRRIFYGYLKQGVQLAGTATTRFCAKLLRERKSLWHFLKKPTIDPTNNLAERNLRHAVLWRKKTFGTQSKRDNRLLERMLTIMMTAKQAGENLIQALCNQLKLNQSIWAL